MSLVLSICYCSLWQLLLTTLCITVAVCHWLIRCSLILFYFFLVRCCLGRCRCFVVDFWNISWHRYSKHNRSSQRSSQSCHSVCHHVGAVIPVDCLITTPHVVAHCGQQQLQPHRYPLCHDTANLDCHAVQLPAPCSQSISWCHLQETAPAMHQLFTAPRRCQPALPCRCCLLPLEAGHSHDAAACCRQQLLECYHSYCTTTNMVNLGCHAAAAAASSCYWCT